MRTIQKLLTAALILFAAASSIAQTSPEPAAGQPCFDNFTATGNFFTGKTLKTKAPLPGMSQDDAYKKAYMQITQRGWQITSAEKEMKIIAAQQQVSLSTKGKTFPYTIAVNEDKTKTTNITISIVLGGGLMASEDAIRVDLCKMVADISN